MKFFLLNPEGCPPNPHLFPVWLPHWKEKGIEIVDRIEDCDMVLMDLHIRAFGYNHNDVEWVCNNSKTMVTFDEWDRGGMSTEKWPYPLTKQQEKISNHIILNKTKTINFCRLLDKTDAPYQNVFPYEKAIMYEEPLLTPDELFNREFDVVFIANESPSRWAIAEAFQQDIRLKTFISIGAKKRPFDEFVNWHKRGKLFISSGAGGYGNERPQYLFSIAGMVQDINDQLLLHQHYDGLTCIKINTPPTKDELDAILEVVNNKEKLYEIYYNNYHYMRKFYSSEYIANDILEKIKTHLC